MKNILLRNRNVNRIEFGTTIWNQVVKPTILHVSSAWAHTSQTSMDIIKTLQYKCAKVVLNSSLNVSKSVLLNELGWEDITKSIEKEIIKYCDRLTHLPNSRLCKLMLEQIRWKTIAYFILDMENSLVKLGLDFMLQPREMYDIYKTFLKMDDNNDSDIITSSALNCSFNDRKIRYHNDPFNFLGVKLKFMARTECMVLNAELKRKNMSDTDECEKCDREAKETIWHFMFECEHFEYDDVRQKFYGDFYNLCKEFDKKYVFSEFLKMSSFNKASFVLGCEPVNAFMSRTDHLCNLCKKFLKLSYTLRFSNRYTQAV